MQNVRVGIVQIEPELGNVVSNTEKAINLMQQAFDNSAEIICLPELFSSGYNQKIIKKNLIEISRVSQSYTLEQISNFCREKKVHVIAPIPEYDEKHNVFYNSAFVINNKGESIYKYRKIHLWDEEKLNFKTGNTIEVFNVKDTTMGLMICYDAGFPEVCRILTLKGAKVIFVPTAWVESGKWSFYIDMAARALENGVYVIAVNRVGREGDLSFFGGSAVFNPRGEQICMLKDTEEVKVINLDLSEVETARQEIPYLMDRKPWLYKEIVEKNYE